MTLLAESPENRNTWVLSKKKIFAYSDLLLNISLVRCHFEARVIYIHLRLTVNQ